MKKTMHILCLLVLLATGIRAAAIGWPAQYEGVMLQGFYWDSYTDTKWTNIESQADELAQSFKLIWVPNSAYAGGSRNMGYMPIYWFTRHTSAFGNEQELRSMISTLKEKGVGVIADVVVNHRNGTSNWTNFPAEQWNGQTWQLGPEHICRNDEVASQPGQATPTGAYDTGENFAGARDLDHTSPVVQNNVKNYVKFLLTDLGYAGVRYDMVKGYAGQYTKIYNQYARPTYSVGEYFDASYDLVAAWIEATGRESAAFDFPGKYAINEAFHSNDLTKLVWKANGTTDQPAGLIHFGYPQLAVTFIDNHDTYRDGSKFNGNVPAANAFILCSPGTPCVFLPHWKAYKSQIKKMIAVRNAVGVTNTSAVTVLKSTRDCYMARVVGKRGELAVRIGSTSDVPAGYTAADVRASGNGYCIWSKTDVGGGGGGDDPVPTAKTIYFDNSVTSWSSVKIHYWGTEESTWPGVDMTLAEGQIWKYTVPAGTVGVLFNDGNGNQTADVLGLTDKHVYRPVSASGKPECEDIGEYGNHGGGGGSLTTPAALYVLGNIKGAQWVTSAGVEMTRNGDSYRVDNIVFEAAAGESLCYFNLTDALGADWNELNMTANRYGAPTEGLTLTKGTPSPITLYANGIDASGCLSWTVAPGTYSIVADFNAGTITVSDGNSGVETIVTDNATATPVYYNLQGVRVDNPGSGLYIERRGSSARRVYLH